MSFKVLSPYVLTTYTRVNEAYSVVTVDRDKGFISEIDIITWIMVGSIKEVDSKQKLDHVYWFPHPVFDDSAMALINGREIFGYSKYLCQYEIPTPDQAPDYFSCAVNAFQPFSEDTKMGWHMLMKVQRNATHAETKLESFLHLIAGAGKFLASVPGFLDIYIDGIGQALDMLLKPKMNKLFLKHFPDSTREKAVY